MTALPPPFRLQWLRTIDGEVSLAEFEQWLYAHPELEAYLPPDDYLALISLSFKKSGARHELFKLLYRHLEAGAYETYHLTQLLQRASVRGPKQAHYLGELYNLYCAGYHFLEDLGLNYGLPVFSDQWEHLSATERESVLAGFSPALEEEIERVLTLLFSGSMVLTGERDEAGRYQYRDQRNP